MRPILRQFADKLIMNRFLHYLTPVPTPPTYSDFSVEASFYQNKLRKLTFFFRSFFFLNVTWN